MERLLIKLKKLIPVKIFKTLQPVYHYLLAAFAAALYRWPSEKIIVIGVTGTTGKTTSVYLIAKTLEAAGFKVGYTSTAMFNDGEREWLNDKKMTMVGRLFTQKMLKTMAKNKCQYAIVETTSEGVKQFRHTFINYDILVFTGLYEEHIESHGSFEKYKEAKGRLFAHLKNCKIKHADEKMYIRKGMSGLKKTDLKHVKKTIIANLDDEHAEYFLNFWSEAKLAYTGQESKKARKQESKDLEIITFGDVVVTQEGTSFKIEKSPLPLPTGQAGSFVKGVKIQLQLLGAFNVINAMNAVCVAISQGVEMEKIKSGLGNIKGVAGRIEKIDEGQLFMVIVDYAFEPNAVAKLYETVKIIPHNKIIHVLGACGGGRDVNKRPILGRLAGENADIVFVTNEDPYDDDPQLIIDQVAIGVEHVGKKEGENLFKILDRREAIEKALALAEEGDIVMITGKGSEQAIVVADGEKITWDDRGVVRGILESRRK